MYEFLQWVELYCTPGKYVAYFVVDKEKDIFLHRQDKVTLIPKVSTEPLIISFMELEKPEDRKTVVDLLKSKNVPTFFVDNIEWDTRKGVSQMVATRFQEGAKKRAHLSARHDFPDSTIHITRSKKVCNNQECDFEALYQFSRCPKCGVLYE